MQVLRLLPVFLAALVLGAHLLRQGWFELACVVAAVPLLLLTRRLWAMRLVQAVFVVGTIEWVRTLALLVGARRAHGLPYTRMLLILAAVAALTAAVVPLVGAWWRGTGRRQNLVTEGA